MESEFLDLASKAKELGVSEGVLRARILSGQASCYVYVARVTAYAVQDQWLPAWTADDFPIVEWVDHGSEFRKKGNAFTSFDLEPNPTPRYTLTGWVELARSESEMVLTRGECESNEALIAIRDKERSITCYLSLRMPSKSEWVYAVGDDGGHWRNVPATWTPADLFMSSDARDANKPLSSRKEQSYLGIIAAMRALLRDKDGGGFPSEAKIIELLVDRFGSVDGVSKRNLEKVFPDATRVAGDLKQDK